MLERRLLESAHRAYERVRLRAALRVGFVIVPIAVVCAWESGAVTRTLILAAVVWGLATALRWRVQGGFAVVVERLVVRSRPGRGRARRVSLGACVPTRRRCRRLWTGGRVVGFRHGPSLGGLAQTALTVVGRSRRCGFPRISGVPGVWRRKRGRRRIWHRPGHGRRCRLAAAQCGLVAHRLPKSTTMAPTTQVAAPATSHRSGRTPSTARSQTRDAAT